MKQIIQTYKKEVKAGLLVLLAVISFFVIADSTFIRELNAGLVSSLDGKKNTVAALAATSVATSTSITLLPNDIGSPVAENIADLTNYIVVIFGAIWLQKYLVGIAAQFFFKLCLPLSAILFAGNLYFPRDKVKELAIKLALFGFLTFALIPTSVSMSNHIEKTHEISVEQTVKQATKENKSLQKEAEKNEDWWSKATSFVTDAYENTMDKVQVTMSNLLDAVAVLIVTTCVIPILVFVFFFWMLRMVFGLDLHPRLPKLIGRKSGKHSHS
ncbi:hypothetical protein [Streptococcus gallinaceus]|uniref:Nitrate reductase NapE component n=1 Tax=Streptococcus gallinaceus TaxID=165758 RepID=A0ABV2JMC7_9STRE